MGESELWEKERKRGPCQLRDIDLGVLRRKGEGFEREGVLLGVAAAHGVCDMVKERGIEQKGHFENTGLAVASICQCYI